MRLVDCFMELFYYTLFLRSLDFGMFSYEKVFSHYKDLFRRIAQKAKKAGFSKEELEAGLFATSAWIDETVFNSGWMDKGKWTASPLQLQLFHTTNAGEEFYQRLRKLDKKDISTREVFDYCLALGFKGKFYQPELTDTLNEIVTDNIKYITDNVNLEYPDRLFSESYAWTTPPPSRKQMVSYGFVFRLIFIITPIVLFGWLYFYFKNSLTNMVIEYLRTGI